MKTVLLVDDDEGVTEAVRFVLQDAGYGVRTVGTPDAAREALRAGGIDACLFDVFLDGDDGLALAAEVASAHDLPLVVMSGGGPGRSLESVTARADAIGAAAVLFKPFDDDELLAALTKATAER